MKDHTETKISQAKRQGSATVPKISVIIPVWNTGAETERMVRELIQGASGVPGEIEIIAVDDGSTDQSLAILKKLGRELGGVLKVISQKNKGASAARNAGINISRGEYLIFVDSDDEVKPEFLGELVGQMESSEEPTPILAVTGIEYRKLAKGTVGDVYLTPRRKRHNREKLSDYVLYLMLLDGRMYGAINKIFRGEIVREGKVRFAEGRDFAEDTQFVLDYLAAGKNTKYASGDIKFILEPLYIYNFGTVTSTVRHSATKWSNWRQSYQDLKNWVKSVDKMEARTRVLLLGIWMRWRVSHLRSVRRAAR